ncbi:hypothetical protein [Reyranella sp.]|uniref:hypothetical protein n=1 Tax=Reyranella sp. TaxID=1929291 RepID=UPI003C7B942E
MSDHQLSVSGKILHVFSHRFVVQTKSGALLADLTPKGLDQIELNVGDTVKLDGEMKPSELKVSRIVVDGRTVKIEHGKPHHHHPHHDDHHHEHHHGPADPKIVLRAAREAGYEPAAKPRRKPKHFEVLGKRNGRFSELHIELDGHIRKTKPADRDEPKWELLRAKKSP